MVGEIRDYETAEIAVQAALTGHLVFSTLHTNDSAGAISRLIEMGVEDYLLSSSLLGVLAQRLVRRICFNCREEQVADDPLSREVGIDVSDLKTSLLYRGRGCDECTRTGFRGRIGIYEFLPVDEETRKVVLSKTDSNQIKDQAVKRGMRTLREDGWKKVREGVTTVSEVFRVTQEE
jgi:general secretion pathway protein E